MVSYHVYCNSCSTEFTLNIEPEYTASFCVNCGEEIENGDIEDLEPTDAEKESQWENLVEDYDDEEESWN